MFISTKATDWPEKASCYDEALSAASGEILRLSSKISELSLAAYQTYLSGVIANSLGCHRLYNPAPRGLGFFGDEKRAVRMCEEACARLESICPDNKAIAPAVRFANDVAGGRFASEAELECAANSTVAELRETLAEYFDGAGGR